MRLLFVADGRSPIALSWIRHFIERGDEVHLVSTFACKPDLPLHGLTIVPVALSSLKKSEGTAGQTRDIPSARTLRLRTAIRQWLGPLTIPRAGRTLRRVIERVQPELVHAMRIPYEGMIAAEAYSGIPLVISVWGNDFTLHGTSTGLMRHYTEWTVQAADALHADCQRDARLAKQWGFRNWNLTLVVPGNGGIQMDVFRPPKEPVRQAVIINPRGFRAYVRNDMFFKAIPMVLAQRPDARFVCPAMAGEPQVAQWIRELNIQDAVTLQPVLPHEKMAQAFRSAQVVASPSVHDGTPNSLLEGMACGCFPVAGDLESIREWITTGKNGLLFDANDAASIAEAILTALGNEDLRLSAAGHNQKMLASRAEYEACMKQAEGFYARILATRR